MTLVVGGVVAVEDTVGRDFDQAAVLDSIRRGSGALLTGDRRYGKTVLSRYVADQLRKFGVLVVEVSAERQSLADFVAALEAGLRQLDGRFAQLGHALKGVTEVDAAGFKVVRTAPPAASLDLLISRAVEIAAPIKLVVVIDEVTVLASALERTGKGEGLQLLHLLRRLRQDNPGQLCMVLLGSVGFHHVTTDALTTTNDLETIPVRHISPLDAAYLAECLLLGEQVPCDDPARVAAAIAASSEQIPYYVQHLVRSAARWAHRQHRPISPVNIAGLVEDALEDPDDPWNLKHYSERIPAYYGSDAELARAVLDVYAAQLTTIPIDEVMRQLGTTVLTPRPTRSDVVLLVDRLESDHYLRRYRAEDRFASDLIRRAWLAFRR